MSLSHPRQFYKERGGNGVEVFTFLEYAFLKGKDLHRVSNNNGGLARDRNHQLFAVAVYGNIAFSVKSDTVLSGDTKVPVIVCIADLTFSVNHKEFILEHLEESVRKVSCIPCEQ